MKKISEISDVVELATAFINIESITGNEYGMYVALKEWLEPRGWIIKPQKVMNKRYNVLAYPKGNSIDDIKILVNSHIDTVPPFFKAYIKDNKLYGRGACDTKSIIASQIIAANELKNDGIKSIGLLYTVGEEVDCIGMINANKLNIKPKYLITGEPTGSRTVKHQKGNYIFKLISKGKACHSGYPQRGQCALTPLLNVLYHIKQTQWPINKKGPTTVNITIQNGGIAPNIVPEYSEATIYFRLTVNSLLIKPKIYNIISKYGNNQVSILNDSVFCEEPQTYNIVDKKYNPINVSFGTDIPSFKSYKNGDTIAILFGPGKIECAHSSNEHICINELRKSINTYKEIILKLYNNNDNINCKL